MKDYSNSNSLCFWNWKRLTFLSFMVAVSCTSLYALTVSTLQEKISNSDLSLESIQFNYLQEMHSTLTSEVHSSSGIAYLKKPKELRIEQIEPEKQLIVSSGKNVFIYTPRFKQVIQESWNRWFANNLFFPGILGFSETFQRFKNEYHWEITGTLELNGEKLVTVHLQSLSKEKDHHLNLWVSESDFIPRKTELVFGTLTLVTTCTSLQKNPELKSDLFRFRRPPDSEMIQLD